MKPIVPILALLLMASFAIAADPTTQPARDDHLEYLATRAFVRGDYATALPLLKRLAPQLADKRQKRVATLQRIAICEKNLALEPPTTQPARIPHKRPADGQVFDISIRGLGNFDYETEAGEVIPPDVRQLDGTKIRLRGFIVPTNQSVRLTQFALVPSLFNCCFGQPPQIEHTVMVTCADGLTVDLTANEVVVEGTLKVAEVKDDGYVVSIFNVRATQVKRTVN
jgi:hypothetical protein